MGKRTPKFWWDYSSPNFDVIVQSDYPGGECLACFIGTSDQKYRDNQIHLAERLISDYESGRRTPPWGIVA